MANARCRGLAAGILVLVLVLVLGLAGCAQSPSRTVEHQPDAEESGRQILIMLPSPAIVELRPYEHARVEYSSGHARNRAVRIATALARRQGIEVLDEWAMPSLDLHCVVARLASSHDASHVLAALNGDPRVAWAQPMERFHALDAPATVQGGDVAPGWNGLDSLHRISTGRRVTIAQIDTGVDLRHPVLSGQWSGPRNFVDQREFPPEMHGTAVAGVTVARADAKTGLVGVSPGARVIPLRGCWEAGPDGAVCSTFTLAKALQHALRESPRVINLSITGPRDRLLETLIDHALDRGIVVVAAGDESGGPGFPASHPRVLAVYGSMPPISSRAMLQAPSQDILTSTPNRTFGFVSGTSFSAAHVSGLTALLLELAPQLTPAQVEALLQSTAASHMNGSKVARIDPCAALSAVAPRSGLACPPAKADRGGRP